MTTRSKKCNINDFLTALWNDGHTNLADIDEDIKDMWYWTGAFMVPRCYNTLFDMAVEDAKNGRPIKEVVNHYMATIDNLHTLWYERSAVYYSNNLIHACQKTIKDIDKQAPTCYINK